MTEVAPSGAAAVGWVTIPSGDRQREVGALVYETVSFRMTVRWGVWHA
jgi:hypothetical protein